MFLWGGLKCTRDNRIHLVSLVTSCLSRLSFYLPFCGYRKDEDESTYPYLLYCRINDYYAVKYRGSKAILLAFKSKLIKTLSILQS